MTPTPEAGSGGAQATVVGQAPVEVSIVIPTRNRRPILLETLAGIERAVATLPVEVIVIDDGSTDGSTQAVGELSERSPLLLRAIRQESRGPAAARNRGIDVARGAACLFLGDDVRPRAALVERHVEFHRAHRESGAALLGLVVAAPPLDASEFVRWLHEGGVQFGFARLKAGRPTPPECFWTANVSAKTALIREAGGFDESFRGAACEDAELGLRLAAAGMRLQFDPVAVGEHFHPMDLEDTLARMRTVGRAYRMLHERAPGFPMPRRPGVRHRLKASALTAMHLARVRPAPVRRASWRFLCDEVQREAYWELPGRDGALQVGSTLARLAARDPAARISSSAPDAP